MSSKPNNWYHMTYDQQQAWQRQEREREDEEYRRREAEEALERKQRNERKMRDEFKSELSSERSRYDELLEDLRDANEERRQLKRFLEAKGLTAEFQGWEQDVIDEDDVDD